MSSFVTNNNSRRTKRARVQHSRAVNSGPVANSTGLSKFESNPNLSTTGKNIHLVDTVIGSHNSKGLTIVGGAANADFSHGNNVDGRDNALGTSGEADGLNDGYPNSNLANPPFPISHHGPGYLKFMDPISIPTVIHPTNFRSDAIFGGNVLIRGSLTVESATLPGAPFTPVIQDALGNELTGVSTDSLYLSDTSIDYFEVLIEWTGAGDLDPAEEIRLTGFPLSNYSDTSAHDVTLHGGVATTAIGAKLHTFMVTGNSYVTIQEADQSGGAAPVALLGANFSGAGGIHITGRLRKV